MPLFTVRKELYEWIKEGKKNIEVRKGAASRGEIAVFQSGRRNLRFRIVKKETGALREVIRLENYKQVIPIAENVEEALTYFRKLYGTDLGLFTAYYVSIQ